MSYDGCQAIVCGDESGVMSGRISLAMHLVVPILTIPLAVIHKECIYLVVAKNVSGGTCLGMSGGGCIEVHLVMAV